MSKAEKITLVCIAVGALALIGLYGKKISSYSSSDPDAPVGDETDFNADGSQFNYNAHGSKFSDRLQQRQVKTKKKLTLNNLL